MLQDLEALILIPLCFQLINAFHIYQAYLRTRRINCGVDIGYSIPLFQTTITQAGERVFSAIDTCMCGFWRPLVGCVSPLVWGQLYSLDSGFPFHGELSYLCANNWLRRSLLPASMDSNI
ncbi:hypothetical protein Tco_0744190 [Tanacetum coccineum]